jgi:hypothetical protein
MRRSLALFVALAIFRTAADSNIDPAHTLSSSDFIGVLNWRPLDNTGATINQYYCSGFIYGSSVGWINLGSGTPANGLSYQNNSAKDFGVNVSPAGELSGFAYGANIGWINFAPAGNPRVDWTTGKFSGSAWSANAGWISLANDSNYLRIESLAALPDTDSDGLPDAWEIHMAGNISLLSANADTDFDGQSDLQEYLAGTDPLDSNDFFGPVRIAITTTGTDLEFPTTKNRVYRIEQHGPFGYANWIPAATAPVIGDGTTATLHLDRSSVDLFYRVVVYPPLTSF